MNERTTEGPETFLMTDPRNGEHKNKPSWPLGEVERSNLRARRYRRPAWSRCRARSSRACSRLAPAWSRPSSHSRPASFWSRSSCNLSNRTFVTLKIPQNSKLFTKNANKAISSFRVIWEVIWLFIMFFKKQVFVTKTRFLSFAQQSTINVQVIKIFYSFSRCWSMKAEIMFHNCKLQLFL